LALGLLLTGTQTVSAQDVTSGLIQNLKKEIVQAIPKEFLQEMKKQFVEDLKRELIAELKIELSQNGKTRMQDTVQDFGKEASSREMSHALASIVRNMNGSGGSNAQATLVNMAKQLLQDRQGEGNRIHVKPPKESVSLNTDLIAVVTNNANTVKSLSVDQIRKLLSGEYMNWKQVGGPDLPVKVIVWSDNQAGLEKMLKAETSADAIRVNYLTLMIPAVDRTKGAIGFLPARNMEQLQFVQGHNALKKVAIRNSEDSPAVTPSLEALKDGSYPMVGSLTSGEGRTVQLHETVH
jgi:phosphate transport system substrate-binding protein